MSEGIPEGWDYAKLGQYVRLQGGYAFKSKDFSDEGIPVVKLGNLYQGRFDLTRDPSFLPHENEDAKAALIDENDILVSQTGTRHKRDYGFFVQIPKGTPRMLLNQRVLAVRPLLKTMTEWIVFASRSEFYRDHFFSTETGGVNQGNVGVGGIMRGPIPLAPFEEAEEIKKILNKCSETASILDAEAYQVESSLAELDQSILSKAFRGELVPQDPSDEPASELLARIRATREQAAAAKKSTKKTRGKKAASKPAAAETTTHKLASWALDLMLLLDAWGKPVPIHCLEPALILMKNDTLRQKLLKTRRSQRQPATSSGPLLTGMKVTLLANLRAGGVIEEVGQNGYKLIDRKHLQQATDEDRDRAAEAIEALTRFMERRELDEPQTRDAVAAMVDSPYELATV